MKKREANGDLEWIERIWMQRLIDFSAAYADEETVVSRHGVITDIRRLIVCALTERLVFEGAVSREAAAALNRPVMEADK
jgi:hypothetical protein